MKFEICTERALLYGAFESPYQLSHSLLQPLYTHTTTTLAVVLGKWFRIQNVSDKWVLKKVVLLWESLHDTML
jgi:hypothetical protein